MLLKILKSLLKLMLPSVKVGAKRKNKKNVEGYYFDGKKSKTLYKKKVIFF